MSMIKLIAGWFSNGGRTKHGDCGRLEIKSLGIGVPLYSSKGKNKQKIVDDENSAVMIQWGSRLIIADHNFQSNFGNLKNAKPGNTIARIRNGESVDTYLCVLNEVGHIKSENGKNRLYDNMWRPVYDLPFGDLCVYTCLNRASENVMDVVLTFWGKINQKGG